MDKQPEALRLAEVLPQFGGATTYQAAAELRRLHASNAELLEALEGAYALAVGHSATYQFQHQLSEPHPTHAAILKKAAEAINNATKE